MGYRKACKICFQKTRLIKTPLRQGFAGQEKRFAEFGKPLAFLKETFYNNFRILTHSTKKGFDMIRILFLLIFSAIFFHFFCEVGKRFRAFLFSHFPDSSSYENEISAWTMFILRVKATLLVIVWGVICIGLLWAVLWSQYNLDMFNW